MGIRSTGLVCDMVHSYVSFISDMVTIQSKCDLTTLHAIATQTSDLSACVRGSRVFLCVSSVYRVYLYHMCRVHVSCVFTSIVHVVREA